MFKIYRIMSSAIFSELFCRRHISYDLRSNFNLVVPNINSAFHGSEIVSYLGPKIWYIVTLEVKKLNSLNVFKTGFITNTSETLMLFPVKHSFSLRYMLVVLLS